jgi:hypothetical protein
LVEGSIHVDRVPQDDGVDDQAKGAELILLALAVALAQFTALAVESLSRSGRAAALQDICIIAAPLIKFGFFDADFGCIILA